MTKENANPALVVPETTYSRRGHPTVMEPAQPQSLMQALTIAAADPRVDVAKVERLYAMLKEQRAREAEESFNAAMARAQQKIVPIANNALNEHTKSRYAKLAAINKAITPIYSAEGLAVSFDTADAPKPELQRIIAIVSHASGHSRQYHIDLPRDDAGAQGRVNKTGVQATGSTNSYGRRYLVSMIFNVSTEDDDDGNAGGDNRMDLNAEADHLAALDGAADDKSLLSAYKGAHDAAIKAGDIKALKKFTERKDARKAQMKEQAK